jgi:hypothetical protein
MKRIIEHWLHVWKTKKLYRDGACSDDIEREIANDFAKQASHDLKRLFSTKGKFVSNHYDLGEN